MRIGIDMGHTLSGPNYGSEGILKESEETRKLGNKVIELLNKEGHTVINCTVDTASSNNASLSGRYTKANAQTLDLFVSLHFNKFDGTAYGSEILTYNGKQLPEAVEILKQLNKLGFTNTGKDELSRGIKNGSHLAVIRNTKARAMLIETCFIDNKRDIELYQKNIEKIAQIIVEGITRTKITSSNGISSSSSKSIETEEIEIPGTLKSSACKENPISNKMIEEIKLLQGVVGLSKDGVGTYKLCKLLPELKGHETRGCVTVMQRILILKGMLSKGSDTGIIGNANRDGIKRFKDSVGVPESNILMDALTWFKLIEY